MCINHAGQSFPSRDGKLLFNCCRLCIDVVSTDDMKIINKNFHNESQPRIDEDKNGDVYISGATYKVKYVRNDNKFVTIDTGVLVANTMYHAFLYATDINIHIDRQIVHTVFNTLPGFQLHGKRNIYYIKRHTPLERRCSLYKLTFNAYKKQFRVFQSKETFDIFNTSEITLDVEHARVFVFSRDSLYIFEMYTLKKIRTFTQVIAFNKKYVITADAAAPITITKLFGDGGKVVLPKNITAGENAILDRDYLLLYDSVKMTDMVIYDMRDLTKSLVIHDTYSSYYRDITVFRVLDDKIILMENRKIRTIIPPAVIKRTLSLADKDTPVGKFINSGLYDRNLLGLITDFVQL
jgi:hypothetical protein